MLLDSNTWDIKGVFNYQNQFRIHTSFRFKKQSNPMFTSKQ